jgi:hypothetical protein
MIEILPSEKEIKEEQAKKEVEFFTGAYNQSNAIQAIVFGIITLGFLFLVGPVLLGIIFISAIGHIGAIVSIFSPAQNTFNLVEFILYQAFFFVLDIIFAIGILCLIVLGVATVNALKATINPKSNQIRKIIICENIEEVKTATTQGFFGIIYAKFEESIKKLFLEGILKSKLNEFYQNGGVVVRTDQSNWPIMKNPPRGWSQKTKIIEDHGEDLILHFMQGKLVGFGKIEKEHTPKILKKMKEMELEIENKL